MRGNPDLLGPSVVGSLLCLYVSENTGPERQLGLLMAAQQRQGSLYSCGGWVFFSTFFFCLQFPCDRVRFARGLWDSLPQFLSKPLCPSGVIFVLVGAWPEASLRAMQSAS